MQGRVLIIAGSDPGGGAGIQGDIKTVTALGGYAAAAITALTAQNTQGVFGIHPVPVNFIAQQIRLVLDDIGADAIKTGMLHSAEAISTIADVLDDYPAIPLVLDPVMLSKFGAPLLQPDAMELLKKRLIPRAHIITPNIPEAELLAGGVKITSREAMEEIGKHLLKLGCKAVLMKGGHLNGGEVTDILLASRDLLPDSCVYTSPRIKTRHTHGTGCTLASAVATGIAQSMSLEVAVARAKNYVYEAIRTAPGLGKGHGPLNHGHSI